MIAINPNAEASTEDRTYQCDSCGCAFARRVAINGLGELVGGEWNKPRKCNSCKKKIVARPGEKINSTCCQCAVEFSYTWDGGPGRRRKRCPDCIGRRQPKPPRDCKECGKKTANGLKAFCSDECKATHKQRLRTASGKHPCGACGKLCLGRVCRACFRLEQHGQAARRMDVRPAFAKLPEALITGRVGEAYFDLIGATEGWRVFLPSGDCTPGVDRLLILDGQTLSVQVKTTKAMESQSYQVKGKRFDADILCIISLESGDMWMVRVRQGQMFASIDGAKAWNFCTGQRGEVHDNVA